MGQPGMDLYGKCAEFKRRPLIDKIAKITDGANEISELNSGQEASTAERERGGERVPEVPSSRVWFWQGWSTRSASFLDSCPAVYHGTTGHNGPTAPGAVTI
ncbi:hypothetical protein VTN00DRAFT_1453 [Thermoascus crustaceus]|uniref:uncharacterized protein n=1 Tax=Thermoascus crustaceus TaxID=5088 RepID=UPI0037442DB1